MYTFISKRTQGYRGQSIVKADGLLPVNHVLGNGMICQSIGFLWQQFATFMEDSRAVGYKVRAKSSDNRWTCWTHFLTHHPHSGGALLRPQLARVTIKHVQLFKWATKNNLTNKVPCAIEILMFDCLKKDVKQCCDATKLDCIHCAHQHGIDQHRGVTKGGIWGSEPPPLGQNIFWQFLPKF